MLKSFLKVFFIYSVIFSDITFYYLFTSFLQITLEVLAKNSRKKKELSCVFFIFFSEEQEFEETFLGGKTSSEVLIYFERF